MSRIGKQQIKTESKLEILDKVGTYGGQKVIVTGKLGTVEVDVRPEITVSFAEQTITVEPTSKKGILELSKTEKSYWGLYRSLIANAVTGVETGYVKELEIIGIGYKAEVSGNILKLNLGFNVPIMFEIPAGIKIEIVDGVDIKITGIDKHRVGETAASIRRLKKPEPYKGKGIRYKGEVVRRKAGKTAA